ncbi:MarR family winged helix-turn-helix transcriptional regulator [Shewanella sedimentimangrovi]|uniref:MarR family transcriptional regulator n=1 Tax=Shewanella sedimentimangrovi TaxID=2814293 RepID=A0ABX7R4I1_9GAMM|nr:helix-turn-helix domain-containing protein [Shewanella sedimentimangrovi]QSX38673.1 MarR family transcriptional regulator [Shewanella sedimentimangrovi]
MQRTTEGQLFTEIVLEVFKLSGLLATEGDRLGRDQDMSSARWKVLGALASTDSPMTVSQVAHAMGQSRQGVQRLANEMQSLGMLDFVDNPAHKKAKLLTVTPQGMALLNAMEQRQIPWANDCARDLDPVQLAQTLTQLRALSAKF